MRLIDAEQCPCETCKKQFNCSKTYCEKYEEWLQKPVYDIDKVVEKLEENREGN